MIINCKEIREQEISQIKETYKGGCKVVFVQAGNNPSSDVYVRNKIKLCEEVGIEVKHIQRDENISQKDLPKLLDKLEKSMKKAAAILDFERAAEIRNQIKKLKNLPF